MNFAAPHIVVYEDVDDPISAADVAKQILSRAWLQYETVTIPADAEERRKTLSGMFWPTSAAHTMVKIIRNTAWPNTSYSL